ncbi:MAG TPA: hypothetical protein VI756_13305 [Blastocatellia bacterium]
MFISGSILDTLHAWHDFFMLTGGASATLMGLLFVSVALVTGLPELPKNRELFATPVVLEFAYAILLSIVCLAPWQKAFPFGIAITVVGVTGAIQSFRLVGRLGRYRVTERRSAVSLWFLYATPAVGMLCAASGVALIRAHLQAIAGIAAVVVALGLLGLRNAWRLLVWVLGEHHRRRSQDI